MSTKIYNGFRMKNLSANELVEFINELRQVIQPEISDAFCQGLALTCRSLIRNAIKYDINFTEDNAAELEEQFLRERYLDSLPPHSSRTLNTIDRIIEEFDEYAYSVLDLSIDLYHNYSFSKNIESTSNDIRSNIAFLPGDNGHLLFICYGTVFIDCLYELIQNQDKFVTKYGIEEYAYWDNTDQLQNVSDEDWEKRGQEWKRALPGAGIPARCGLCTSELIDGAVLFDSFKISQDGREQKVLEILSDTASVTEGLARDMAINRFILNDKRYTGTWLNAADLCTEYTQEYNIHHSEVRKCADEYEKLIPQTPISEILENSLLKLMPRYMKWRENNGNKHQH